MIAGRFAPTPSGPLHFGSLVAAVASYLDARARGGRWLVRIEDIDTPRVAPVRPKTSCVHSNTSDSSGTVQCSIRRASRRLSRSSRSAQARRAQVFPCSCTRTTTEPCRCTSGTRWRVRFPGDDFTVLRADGIFAYQLAVVVDDAFQEITDVVRGADLLDSTPRQKHLQKLLGLPTLRYVHVPIVTNENGEKLSKQTLAPSLEVNRASELLCDALRFLSQPGTIGR